MFDPEKGVKVATEEKPAPAPAPEAATELKCHPSCTYGTAAEKPGSPICRKHQAEKDALDVKRAAEEQATADAKAAAAPGPEAPPAVDPLAGVKFPPLDNLGSHFYDNEAGTFWVGLNLRNDPVILAFTMDGAKLPMVQASMDFRGREARRQSLISRVKETAVGMKEGLEKMLGRVGAGGKKSILSR
jgi:hypothetical protein